METPVTSVGNRSGVNWMRLNTQPVERAMLRASIVLPTPGTSSISTCPWQSSAVSVRRNSSVLPTITFSTLLMMPSAIERGSSTAATLHTPHRPQPCPAGEPASNWPVGRTRGHGKHRKDAPSGRLRELAGSIADDVTPYDNASLRPVRARRLLLLAAAPFPAFERS